MRYLKSKRQSLGWLLACILLVGGVMPVVDAVQGPARAESGFEDFMARLKRKTKKGQADQPASVRSNANTGHGTVVGGGKATTDTEVVAAKNIAPMLAETGAAELRAASERYRAIIANGGFPKVARANLKKGSQGKGVIALNQRLYAEGYIRAEATQGEFAGLYTSATEDGVRRFQQNMGLAATGRFDAVTADIMNIPAQRRLAAIEANIPRVEAYTQGLGDRYVVVNIPAQQIETVSGGRVFSKHNAIVGRPERPSPVVMTALTNVAFNPYWNAPVSIVEKDIIPKLKGGTDVLRDMNIKVFKGFGGPEIDPDTINWRSAIPDDYHFRQEPGEGNAMATAKINFLSPFGVYMHDTPEKQLFNSNNRFYSSGCVRVQDMSLLVNWVLNGQDGIGEAEISTLAETLERRDVDLTTPPQLRFAYLTAWPTTGGTVAFRSDIYELDGTGFVTGQPMPVGEMSPDGQRYVLKPLPRLVASVEDDSGGSGFFGFSKKKPANGTAKRAAFFNASTAGDDDRDTPSGAIFKKVNPPANAKKVAAKPPVKSKGTLKSKKDAPGLFDWAAWRKEQASSAKGGKNKKTVKKSKADAKSIAAEKKKLTPATAKKSAVADKEKVAADEKKVASTDKAKSPTVAVKKKPAEGTTAKVQESATAKKPAAKKLDCKAEASGTLPDGCKAAAVDKKKPAAPVTAAN